MCPSNINLAEIFTQAKRIDAYERQNHDHKVAIKQRYIDHQERALQRSQSAQQRRAQRLQRRRGVRAQLDDGQRQQKPSG